MGNEYTMDEVRMHDKPNDLWIVINGNVYDVTKFYKDVRIRDICKMCLYIICIYLHT